MAGGPVTGSAIPTGIIIPTTLQMANDALDRVMSLTCLYDRYWVPEPDKVTLPICMFHVKKIVPTRTVETSKKRVIVYEPKEDNKLDIKTGADSIRPGVMRSIVDNAVKQPTTYAAELIVPFQPVGRSVMEGVKTVFDMVTGFADWLGGNDGFLRTWESASALAFAGLKLFREATDAAGRLAGMDGLAHLNMNSLEAMADGCRVLCMKMWTGMHYKFVRITNMTHEKQPLEDDVFRANLTMEEVPVLCVTRPNAPVQNKIKQGWAVQAAGRLQGLFTLPLVGLTGVRGENAANDAKGGMGSRAFGNSDKGAPPGDVTGGE